MTEQTSKRLTVVGTDIDDVKSKNANSGMSYNEAKAFIARETGGQGTSIYSDTNPEEIKREIATDTQK